MEVLRWVEEVDRQVGSGNGVDCVGVWMAGGWFDSHVDRTWLLVVVWHQKGLEFHFDRALMLELVGTSDEKTRYVGLFITGDHILLLRSDGSAIDEL